MAGDPEILALNSIKRTLQGLQTGARKRVINWVVDKLEEESAPKADVFFDKKVETVAESVQAH